VHMHDSFPLALVEPLLLFAFLCSRLAPFRLTFALAAPFGARSLIRFCFLQRNNHRARKNETEAEERERERERTLLARVRIRVAR
jgi:hypothetical protein